MLSKMVVILGPTTSGKSDLAVKLAKKFKGEIISADSRQVYKGLNIGTGKITRKEMSKIPHHLLNVASPKRQFSVSEYKRLAEKVMGKILNKERLPIICGGTGLYIDALLGKINIPEVPPNSKLRKQLEKKSLAELFKILQKLDPRRAEEIDHKNPRRLVRAIEIAKTLGPRSAKAPQGNALKYNALKIGIQIPKEELRKRINRRLKDRIKKGMVDEARKLHTKGLSYKRMRELGLEYRRLADFFENKITKVELVSILEKEIWQYAKRQMQWFKRDQEIIWLPPKVKDIEKEVSKFLK